MSPEAVVLDIIVILGINAQATSYFLHGQHSSFKKNSELNIIFDGMCRSKNLENP